MERYDCNKGLFFHFNNPTNIALVFYLVHITAYDTLRNVNPLFSLLATMGNYVFLLLIVNALPVIVRSFTKSVVVAVFLFAILEIVSLMIAPNEAIHFVMLSALFRFGLPCFLIGISIQDIDDLIRKLHIASIIILLCIGLSVFVFKSNSLLSSAYSQDMGYEALIPFVIFLGYLINKRTVIDIVGVVISIIFVIMSGARGPLLCLLLSFIVVIMLYTQASIKKLVILAGVGAVGVVALYVWFQPIVKTLISLFDSYGVSTRILYGLLNNDLSDDAMRGKLRAFAWEYAKYHLAGGTGFVNDRQLIYQSLLVGVANGASGTYVHNFFLELMMQFGLVPGLTLSIVFCVKLIHSFSKKYLFNARLFLATLLSVSFWPLMISRSYLSVAYFYLLCGFLLGIGKFVENWHYVEGEQNNE